MDFEFKAAEEYKPGEVVLSREQILICVDRIADAIVEKYQGAPIIFVTILNGAVPFSVDLQRALAQRGCLHIVNYNIRASSYTGTESTGAVTIEKDSIPDAAIAGANVILLDDICDTGLTLSDLQKLFLIRGAVSVETCVLVDKPSGRNELLTEMTPDYSGATIPGVWVCGGGMGMWWGNG